MALYINDYSVSLPCATTDCTITTGGTSSASNVIYIMANDWHEPEPVKPAMDDAVGWLRRRVEETCWSEAA